MPPVNKEKYVNCFAKYRGCSGKFLACGASYPLLENDLVLFVDYQREHNGWADVLKLLLPSGVVCWWCCGFADIDHMFKVLPKEPNEVLP